jgi:hypothetical protein
MATTSTQSAEAKIVRAKDKVTKLTRMLEEARLEAATAMLVALDAKLLKRSRLADLWNTSIAQVDRMIARARAGRR